MSNCLFSLPLHNISVPAFYELLEGSCHLRTSQCETLHSSLTVKSNSYQVSSSASLAVVNMVPGPFTYF